MVSKNEAGSTRQTTGQKVVHLKTKESSRPHAKMPHEDLSWVLTQSPTVIRLFIESWRSESFGKQQRSLSTTLRGQNLRNAMRVLEKAGLFKYEPVMEQTLNYRWVIVGWKCENLHGYYCDYWDKPADSLPSTDNTVVGTDNTVVGTDNTLVGTDNTLVGTDNTEEQPETQSGQDFQIRQPRLNHCSTTHQLPTKVVGGVVSIPSEETEAPLGGVLPTSDDGIPEEESPQGAVNSPTVNGGEEEVSVETSTAPVEQAEDSSLEAKGTSGGKCSAAAPGRLSNAPVTMADVMKDYYQYLGVDIGSDGVARVPEQAGTPTRRLTDEQKAAYEAQQRELARKWQIEESLPDDAGDVAMTQEIQDTEHD